MTDSTKELLNDYVRACGGDPRDIYETMEQRIAREKLAELTGETAAPDDSAYCHNCPCSNCNAL